VNAKGSSGAHRIQRKRTQIPPSRHSSIDPEIIGEPELPSSPRSTIEVRDSRGDAEEDDAAYNNHNVDDAAHDNAEVNGATKERQWIDVDGDDDDDDKTQEETARDELRAFKTNSA
jgi:hypothetical protein